MAPPSLSLDEARPFRKAYRDALRAGHTPRGRQVGTGKRSAIAVAAEALRISLKQAYSRAEVLDEHAPGWDEAETPAPFVPPVLPSGSEPFEELLDRREAQASRKREAAKAREWMRFEIPEVAPFALVFVGDPHADDDGCDLGALRRDLSLIEGTPGMHAVGMGDWCNSWVGSLSRLYADQGTTAADAWRFAEWMLSKPIWLVLLLGNHDLWHGAGSPLRWMAREGRAPIADWQAKFRVACGNKEWRIHAAHDFPGNSQWNRLHAPLKRAKMTGHDADLYVCGHKHNFGLAQEQDEHSGRVSWLARARGYKTLDSYANVLGHGQAQTMGHSIVAVCDPDTGSMTCFADVPLAATYLTWLRRPKVRVQARTA